MIVAVVGPEGAGKNEVIYKLKNDYGFQPFTLLDAIKACANRYHSFKDKIDCSVNEGNKWDIVCMLRQKLVRRRCFPKTNYNQGFSGH
jgi:hypothetical protein